MNEIPSRSRLYGLVPCGLGTMFQESLTSYLNRLGWRHHVSPRDLVAQELFRPSVTSIRSVSLQPLVGGRACKSTGQESTSPGVGKLAGAAHDAI